MSYYRQCGSKLAEDMAYCPKYGTPVAFKENKQPVRYKAKSPFSLAIGGIIALAAAAIIVIALIIGGFLPSDLNPIIGSGNVQTQQYALSDFSAVSAGNGFNVIITQANTYSINITADDNMFNNIQVEKTGSTLNIRIQPNIGIITTTLRAEISMPDLQTTQFSGGVVATATGFNSTHNFRIDMSGGSRLTLTGQAANLTAVGSGGTVMDLANFKVNNAQIDFSGGTQGTITIDGRLDANLSGGSQLHYLGNAILGDINTSGGASISKIS